MSNDIIVMSAITVLLFIYYLTLFSLEDYKKIITHQSILHPFINLTYYWGGQFKSFNKRHISGELVRAVCAGCAQNCAKTGYFRGGVKNDPFGGGSF